MRVALLVLAAGLDTAVIVSSNGALTAERNMRSSEGGRQVPVPDLDAAAAEGATTATTAAPAPTAPAPAPAPTDPTASAGGVLTDGAVLPPAEPTAAPEIPPNAKTIVKPPNEATPSPPPVWVVNETEKKWANDFMTADPLTKGTGWASSGPWIVLGLIVVAVLGLVVMCVVNFGEEEETEVELPDNMYGETISTLLVSTSKMSADGASAGTVCELFSSISLLLVTYMCIYIMVQVAVATIGNVEADVEERDSLFNKFREPSIWMTQDWEHFPDTAWRRESMVWFCHDIIYGKAKHVNELGPEWDEFSFIVLFIWFAHMLNELREVIGLADVTWSAPNVASAEQVTIDKGEDKIVVNGMSTSTKIVTFLTIVLPKFVLNCYVAYIGAYFLIDNDLDDDLQEILLKTIEMAFILEMDELIFQSFTSSAKKEQLGKVEMPACPMSGCSRIVSRFGDYPRFIVVVVIASVLCYVMHTEERAKNTLSPKQVGVIEGCCNFMEYLKGTGVKTPLVEGNPCVSFREKYEMPMGIPVYVAPPKPEGVEEGGSLMQTLHGLARLASLPGYGR